MLQSLPRSCQGNCSPFRASRVQTQSCRTFNVCRAQSHHRPELRADQSGLQQVLNRASASISAAALAIGLLLSQPVMPALAAPQSLAEIVKEEFGFVDPTADGIISRDELQQVVKQISQDEALPLLDDAQLDFSMRLYDLNGDGVLKSEELLRALALDGAVDDDAIDKDVVAVFDRNNNGTIDRAEFRQGLGDLGPDGTALKDFVFDRVDRLTQSNGQLDLTDFANALTLARVVVLGY